VPTELRPIGKCGFCGSKFATLLLALHRAIYDLESAAPQEDRAPIQCNSPSFSKTFNKARFAKGRSKNKIDVFFERDLNLTICLPPKCGTTNWQNALVSLSGGHGKGNIPMADPADFTDAKRINKMSDVKIINTRNPFQPGIQIAMPLSFDI
jgi:hypothetical protein